MSLAAPSPIARYLEELARGSRTTTYSELAERFGLPAMEGTWNSHPLCQVFDALDQEDANAGRPLRTAVVIRKDMNMPDSGYFESRTKYKGGAPITTDKERLKAWLSDLSDVFNYKWPKA